MGGPNGWGLWVRIPNPRKSQVAICRNTGTGWSAHGVVFYSRTLFHGKYYMSRDMRFSTMWNGRPAKAQTSLRIRAD